MPQVVSTSPSLTGQATDVPAESVTKWSQSEANASRSPLSTLSQLCLSLKTAVRTKSSLSINVSVQKVSLAIPVVSVSEMSSVPKIAFGLMGSAFARQATKNKETTVLLTTSYVAKIATRMASHASATSAMLATALENVFWETDVLPSARKEEEFASVFRTTSKSDQEFAVDAQMALFTFSASVLTHAEPTRDMTKQKKDACVMRDSGGAGEAVAADAILISSSSMATASLVLFILLTTLKLADVTANLELSCLQADAFPNVGPIKNTT
jgi:hypothetical protein